MSMNCISVSKTNPNIVHLLIYMDIYPSNIILLICDSTVCPLHYKIERSLYPFPQQSSTSAIFIVFHRRIDYDKT